jgi:hypothetical protein
MPDTFVPLVPPAAKPREAAFASLPFNGSASGAAPSASDASKPAGAGADACAKPVVTLQRNGETVSGIRIQCGCGQVVDLACVY